MQERNVSSFILYALHNALLISWCIVLAYEFTGTTTLFNYCQTLINILSETETYSFYTQNPVKVVLGGRSYIHYVFNLGRLVG